MVVMKFPKSKFPSRDLDDISMRLMESGESKNFEVPTQYLTFLKKTQLDAIEDAGKAGKRAFKPITLAERLGIPKGERNSKVKESTLN